MKILKLTCAFLLPITVLIGCKNAPLVQSAQYVQSNPKKGMLQLLNDCDSGQAFDVYVDCIKITYHSQGNAPGIPIIKVFYSNLDMINEAYANKAITNAQAKSQTYDSYMKTIHAENTRNRETMFNIYNMR
jgi:hypothetical protein